MREIYSCLPVNGYYPVRTTNSYVNLGNQLCKEMFFNILGRLCHLLSDMGVPEHAKRSIHIDDNWSPFKHWLRDDYDNEFYWTAERVYNERGGFVNPFCEYNDDKEIGFLFYTLAQLSDWFASYGALARNGNENYNVNVGEIHSIINSYTPIIDPNNGYDMKLITNRSKKLYTKWNLQSDYGRKYREVLLPYTIRAVAGLMYKYIIETRMQYPNAATGKGTIFSQQQELNLYNQDINGDYYTFRAEGLPGKITVCPETRPAGYPADFVIGPNARNVTFRAAKEIVFKPGFTATEGSEVHAYIGQEGVNCEQCLEEDYNPQYNRRP